MIALERAFTMEDQVWFAAQTGDWNPLHIDPLVARRTLFGGPVVHGLHLLCWAVDAALLSLGVGRRLVRLQANFENPLPVGKPAKISYEIDAAGGIRIKIESDRPVASIGFTMAAIGHKDASPNGELLVRTVPKDRDFADCACATGEFPVAPMAVDMMRRYGVLISVLGALDTAALLATTRLVGMECPGLHSIFGGLDLSFGDRASEPVLRYRVERADSRFSLLTLTVAAMTMHGKINAFLRPPPALQPSFASVRGGVAADEFAGVTALVIGGSRGLGEIVAKCLAAGGAAVTITYRDGEAEAAAVAREIAALGGRAQCVRLDIDTVSVEEVASLVGAVSVVPNAVFYFASPKIDLGRSGSFDPALFMTNARSFVTSPCALAQMIAPLCRDGALHFYPSTAFLDAPMLEGAEYRAAKAAGEISWQSLGQVFETQRFVAPRLPRLRTDQTASLRPEMAAEPLPVMLAALRTCLAMTERLPNIAYD